MHKDWLHFRLHRVRRMRRCSRVRPALLTQPHLWILRPFRQLTCFRAARTPRIQTPSQVLPLARRWLCHFFTLEEMSVDIVVAKPPFQLDSWRFAFASVLHLTLQHLCLKMGAVITAEDVVYLHSFVPQEIRGYQPILLILMTLQAVIATPNFIFILREWARRACKVQAPDV